MSGNWLGTASRDSITCFFRF